MLAAIKEVAEGCCTFPLFAQYSFLPFSLFNFMAFCEANKQNIPFELQLILLEI